MAKTRKKKAIPEDQAAAPVLTADQFGEMESRGRVKLGEVDRKSIQQLLADYCEVRCASAEMSGKQTEKHLSEFLKGLELAVTSGERLQAERDHSILAQVEDCSGVGYPAGLPLLRQLRDSARATLTRPRLRGQYALDELLRNLASIYKRAGGESVAVQYPPAGAGGPFLEFASYALSRLPPNVYREHSRLALARRWERAQTEPKTGTWLGSANPRGPSNKRILSER